MPTPSVEEGNNLSYAVQWVLFALMAAAALIWRIRRDSAIESGSLKRGRKKQSDLDAAAEDEATKAK
jgi:cytochrome oxidase assembly protein ShyY1